MISLLGRLHFFSPHTLISTTILREDNLVSKFWEGSGVSGTGCCLEGTCYVFCNTRTQCAFVFHVSCDTFFFFFEKLFSLAHIREVGNIFLFISYTLWEE